MNDRIPLPRPSLSYVKQKNSGNGTLTWQTRRANEFRTAAQQLSQWRTADLEDLRIASHSVSVYIAELVPEGVMELPRGYRITTVWTHRLLSLDGAVFSSSVPTSMLASREQLARLSYDLLAGLVSEIRESVKKSGGVRMLELLLPIIFGLLYLFAGVQVVHSMDIMSTPGFYPWSASCPFLWIGNRGPPAFNLPRPLASSTKI